jgi:hypothetical protein
MWLERSVMFPALHSTIRDILVSTEALKVQFVLEPLAFPQILSAYRLHGQAFIDQLSYLTRTFAFNIHREYQKLIELPLDNPNPYINLIPDKTNSLYFPVEPNKPAAELGAACLGKHPYQSPVRNDVLSQEGSTSLCQLSVLGQMCPVSPTIPSTEDSNSNKCYSPVQTDVLGVQSSSSDTMVQAQPQSECEQAVQCQGHDPVGSMEQELHTLNPPTPHTSTHHQPCSGTQ